MLLSFRQTSAIAGGMPGILSGAGAARALARGARGANTPEGRAFAERLAPRAQRAAAVRAARRGR